MAHLSLLLSLYKASHLASKILSYIAIKALKLSDVSLESYASKYMNFCFNFFYKNKGREKT